VLAKAMLATVNRDPANVALVVFDLIPQPGPTQRIDVDTLAGVAVPEGVGIIAATETATTQGPTPLAAALVAALAGPEVRTEGVLASVKAKLAGNPATVVAWHVPAHSGFLAGGPAASPPHPPPPPVAPVAAAVAAPAAPQVAPAIAAPVAAAPQVRLPDEAQMTEFDRRQVQNSLLRLGYYDRAVDAMFGPETRAAIRRYQHEIGGQMTGYLTADQATRLVNSR
jgi:peptidoglycan hydrolase-like protein with peptidoglycan-binding domain